MFLNLVTRNNVQDGIQFKSGARGKKIIKIKNKSRAQKCVCILIPEAKFSMKGTKCLQQCLVPRSPWAPTISRALSEHGDREVTEGLAHRGDDTRLACGTRTVGAGGA